MSSAHDVSYNQHMGLELGKKGFKGSCTQTVDVSVCVVWCPGCMKGDNTANQDSY